MWKLLSLILVIIITISGCAGTGAILSGLSLASNIIPIIDSFYDTVVETRKTNPNLIDGTTIILQRADDLVKKAREGEVPGGVSQAILLQTQAESLTNK